MSGRTSCEIEFCAIAVRKALLVDDMWESGRRNRENAVNLRRFALARRLGIAAAACAIGASVVVAPVALANPRQSDLLSWLPLVQERPDADSDGLYDDDETDVYGTDPGTADTDGDGPDDGQEVYDGTDPLTPNSDEPYCPDGQEPVGGFCPTPAPIKPACPDGQQPVGGFCPTPAPIPVCPDGQQPLGGFCPTPAPIRP